MLPRNVTSSNRRLFLAVAVMVVVWLAAMLYRNEIRARWWLYRLTSLSTTDGLDPHARYLARLASVGEAALPAAERLLQDSDTTLRSFGVTLLQRLQSPRAGELLLDASSDPDPVIRGEAVRGLGGRGDVTSLRRIVRRDDPVAACAAVEALASVGSQEAVEIIISQVRNGAARDGRAGLPVRVQAIESLGELQAGQAVEALIDCLADQTFFEGWTAAERSAAAAVAAMRPGNRVNWPEPRTVAQYAAEALQRITGRSWDPGISPEEDR